MGEEQDTAVPEISHSFPETAAGKISIRRAIELVSSLISLSYSIKAFSVKWHLIRNKLEELQSVLLAVENCDSGDNPALINLIPAITATSGECQDLARQCLDLSYSGKLLMQSDLDVMSTKFDRHVKSLAGIYTAGVLTHGFAIVVSRPGIGACRNDMRFYVGDLLTRMKIGDADMQRQALVNFHAVLAEDDRYVKLIGEIEDIVFVVVNFLDSAELEIQEESAKLVSLLAGFGSCKCVLVGAGIIAPLIRVLESGTQQGKEAAARSLQRLTENSDNAWSVSSHGGVTALLKICGGGGETELIVSASGVLRNLVGVDEIKRFMIEEGAISTFVKLARSRDEILQINSMGFLQSIGNGDDSIRQLIVREGGVRALLQALDSKSSHSSKTRETSLRAIESLCFTSANSIASLMGYGFVHQLLFWLRNGEPSVQEQALKVAHKLCGASEEAKKRMGDSGFMPELIRLLDAKSYEVRETAAAALASMVAVPRNRKRFLEEEQNVRLVMQMLDPEEGNSGNKKFLLSTLMSLTSCNSGRRKIASSGYAKNIEKLAEAQVSDAKRLVRKLSGGRFRSMLSGFWYS